MLSLWIRQLGFMVSKLVALVRLVLEAALVALEEPNKLDAGKKIQ